MQQGSNQQKIHPRMYGSTTGIDHGMEVPAYPYFLTLGLLHAW